MTKPFYKVRNINTVRDIIDSAAELYPERPAFEIKEGKELKTISYTQYRNDINALCNSLIDYNITDKKVIICADNCYEYCLTYIAVICSGGIIVPVDKELCSEDIGNLVKLSNACMIFADKKYIGKATECCGNINHIFCFGSKGSSNDRIPPFSSLLGYGYTLEQDGRQLWKGVKQDTEKTCTLLFTSGTIDASKGVMLCQRNFVFEVKAAMSVLKIYPSDCGISLLPFHHTFESSIILFFAPYCGAKVTFCEGIKYVLRNMSEFSPTIFVAVPLVLETVHKRILQKIKEKKNGELKFKIGKALCKAGVFFHIDLKKIIFKEIQDTFGGSMRMIICGGAPIDPQIIKDFDAFGIQIVYGYGLTECAPLAIINNDRCRTVDSIGEPLPEVEVKIISRDENGIGELCIKGGMVMNGYYNDPVATEEAIDKDGFLHTGDLGYADKKGHYHITGRCKNVIVQSNGKNVYPEEIEEKLNSQSFISASLVEPDKNNSDKIHARIFPDIGELKYNFKREPTAEEIEEAVKDAISNVNEQIPSYKRVYSYEIMKEDFERTTAKKIKRYKIN